MFRLLARILPSSFNGYSFVPPRYFNQVTLKGAYNHKDQIEYIKSEIVKNDVDWSALKSKVFTIPGSVTPINVDAILLKTIVNSGELDAGVSFAEYLRKSSGELSLGAINGLLILYYEMGRKNELCNEEKMFILNTYKDLYAKYKILDFKTSENLLHVLCIIGEWKKALKVLDNIYLSNKPSHSAYSVLITSLFKCNKKTEAMKMIQESIKHNRPLQTEVYEAWINYILNRYKDKKTILKYLEDICLYLSTHFKTINVETARKLRELYGSAGWDVQFTSIRKNDGQCMHCGENLDPLMLSEEEFRMLQKNIKDKLIVGSDLFLKTSPDELKRFQDFVEKTGPYDIVLDALNIAYAVGKNREVDKLGMLNYVVDYYRSRNKKIMVLGRKHMLSWKRNAIRDITNKTCSFFTDDLSQDDPYFITAAILSGPHTDIVSKDLLRGHRFLLHDQQLEIIFRKWQWQHQWMVYTGKFGKIIMKEPLLFNPYAQKNNYSWHLPYDKERDESTNKFFNDGSPDLSSWLCLRPNAVR